jgi:hypothetical protein
MLRSRHKEKGREFWFVLPASSAKKRAAKNKNLGLGGVVKQAEALPPPVPVALILTPSAP